MTFPSTATGTTTSFDVREVSVPAVLALEFDMSAGNGPGEIGAAMGKAFSTLMNTVQQENLVIIGPPRAIYRTWDATGTQFTAAIPIVDAPAGFLKRDVKVVAIPEQQALRFVHHGSYQTISQTYARIHAWLRERGAITSDADWARYSPMWEEYIGDPTTTPEEKLMTHIYLSLR
jgi:effector-binding domain-containing protein